MTGFYGQGPYGTGVYGVGESLPVDVPSDPVTPLPVIDPAPVRFVVEVRDRDLVRQGQITMRDMDFQYDGAFNNVGTWSLSLAAEHPMVDVLSRPGAGIIIYGPSGIIDSGPVTQPEKTITPTDPAGTVMFKGVTDTVLLADALAWPVPGSPAIEGQTLSHDVRTGSAEALMHAYVNANIGPGAPLERRGPLARKLVMGPNLGRGPTRNKSARFNVLGNLLDEIAATGNLGFRIIQAGDVLEFQTFVIADRSGAVRLDVRNRTLSGQKTTISAPGVTHVLVAGQGQQEERAFLLASNAASVGAMNDWGRRIERFVDQRQTDDENEYLQKAQEILEEEGFTAVSLTAIPNDDETPTMRYGVDWKLGDKVTIVIDGIEYASVVAGVLIKVNSDGIRIAAKIGSTPEASQSFESRLSSLERNAESVTKDELQQAILAAVAPGVTPGLSRWKSKTSDDDYASTTLVADSELYFDLAGAAEYEVEFLVAAIGPGDVKFDVTWPPGATGAKAVFGPTSAPGTYVDRLDTSAYYAWHGFERVHTHQVSATLSTLISIKVFIKTAGAGRLALRAAQATASAGPTVVQSTSRGRLTRIS